MNTNMKRLQAGLNIVGGVALVTSFFIADSKKAVNRRWWALGFFGTAWVIHVAQVSSKSKA